MIERIKSLVDGTYGPPGEPPRGFLDAIQPRIPQDVTKRITHYHLGLVFDRMQKFLKKVDGHKKTGLNVVFLVSFSILFNILVNSTSIFISSVFNRNIYSERIYSCFVDYIAR